jgi:hypothetical protein
MTDIHSCSYYCTRPACVLAQRDELRDKLQAEPVAWVPVHPVQGPLWAMTTDNPSPERLPQYPLRALYAAPPAKQAEPVVERPALFNELGEPMFGTVKLSGCAVCGIGAGKVMGYVCPRNDCPMKVTSGGAV